MTTTTPAALDKLTATIHDLVSLYESTDREPTDDERVELAILQDKAAELRVALKRVREGT
jgi:hypothetical protein